MDKLLKDLLEASDSNQILKDLVKILPESVLVEALEVLSKKHGIE